MDNYLRRERIKTASSRPDAKERWKWEALGRRAKGNRTSTGGRKIKSYAETGSARHPTRVIKANPIAFGDELAGALAQLPPKHRVVFEGRVLAEPQVSLGELADRLNVKRPRIVAIEKTARQRMAKLLRR